MCHPAVVMPRVNRAAHAARNVEFHDQGQKIAPVTGRYSDSAASAGPITPSDESAFTAVALNERTSVLTPFTKAARRTSRRSERPRHSPCSVPERRDRGERTVDRALVTAADRAADPVQQRALRLVHHRLGIASKRDSTTNSASVRVTLTVSALIGPKHLPRPPLRSRGR